MSWLSIRLAQMEDVNIYARACYCMDYLGKNIDWLEEKSKPLIEDHYLLFDFPGEVELFFLHSNARSVINKLIKKLILRLTAVHLIDAHLCCESGKYVSALLLSLSTMLHLELPHINVLSKIDLIENYGNLAFNLDFYTDVQDLSYLQHHLEQDPRSAKYRKLTKELCDVIDDFGIVNFSTLDIQDKESVGNLVKLIDKSNGYIFSSIDSSAVELSKIAAAPLDWDYYRDADGIVEYNGPRDADGIVKDLSSVQEYNGPRDADGIVEYLKKQVGPASVEIKSVEDTTNLISDKGVVTVGVFPEFGGSEFENFVAEKMRIDYDFLHTLDANILRGDMAVKGPAVRLFKPFDELFIDSQDFDKDALQKFIEVSGFPTVVTFDTNPTNHKYLRKYFENDGTKAMLFLSFDDDRIETFKSQFYEAAKQYGDKNISFLIGDVTDAQGAFQYFGLKESEVPLLFIQASAAKYIKPTVEPDQIVPWLKEYTDGTILPHVKSDSIPLVNYQPVKVVVADNLNDVVFNSGKNVLLEFYGPWCGHCQKLAPILDEVAVSLQNDAKMDATTNDIPPDFAVEGYSTMYFYSSAGNLLSYERGRTAEEIINSIKKNKGSKPGEAVVEDDAAENDAMEEQQPAPESVKDQL